MESLFVAVPVDEKNSVIVQIRCPEKFKEGVKNVLKSKFDDEPRFQFIPIEQPPTHMRRKQTS